MVGRRRAPDDGPGHRSMRALLRFGAYTPGMDEQQPKRGGLGRLLWFFVILAVVVLWWYLRPEADPGATATAQAADAYTAPTDPDDILVDLRDDATPEL